LKLFKFQVVKSMTSIVGFTVGDLLAQKFVEGKEEFDLKRTLRFASFGGLV
jgi:hypothetical protein